MRTVTTTREITYALDYELHPPIPASLYHPPEGAVEEHAWYIGDECVHASEIPDDVIEELLELAEND